MADEIFENPLLAKIYDPLDPDRSDLELYLRLAEEFGSRKVLDVGCGTGTLALLLAMQDVSVVGVDPAFQSLEVARSKQNADVVTWIHGYAQDVPSSDFDLVTMTGNVAQAIVEKRDWNLTLASIYDRLITGGIFAFESRDPAMKAWEHWNKEKSFSVNFVDGVGRVESWVDLIELELPLVTFEWTWIFESGERLTSKSTLRFRERDELEVDVQDAGFIVEDVRDAPDRPGLEFVFIARRT